MKIFDSHAHYDDEAFDEDRDSLLSELGKSCCRIINNGSDLKSSNASVMLARKYPYISAAVGIHPENALLAPTDYIAQLEKLLRLEEVVAIGEIGLDYHYDDAAPREIQRRLFEEQLALAVSLDMPVIVHDRDAHGDTMELLRRYRPRGVMHCFSGSVEMASELISLGMYIGLGGAVTFKNAKKVKAVAAAVPLSRILTETDAPYMSPTPFRGTRCDSSMIRYTADEIAQLRGITSDEVLGAAAENASLLFSL